jgi:hypothetical protein
MAFHHGNLHGGVPYQPENRKVARRGRELGRVAAGATLLGTLPKTSLADLVEPDQWFVSGKNLLDFPWPDDNNEREAMGPFRPAPSRRGRALIS